MFADLDRRIRKHMNSFGVILAGFAALILIGALLLKLPVSSRSGQSVPFINALFTSASATCVTGLVVYDTATQWSLFGRIVILILIQIGGLGVITMFLLVMLITGHRIDIFQRLTMQDAVSAPQIGGIVKFTRFFLTVTVLIEAAGAVLLLPSFAMQYGFWKGLGFAVFHSISAFCNAGFDVLGEGAPFSSMTRYAGSPGINLTLMMLIIVGGLGYLTWEDLLEHKFRIRELRLQSKMILSSTVILIALPFLYFLLFEFQAMPMQGRVLASLFQAVTPRTAGFNTVDYAGISETGQLLTVILMIIGGAPGSTAGGMKITTAAVLLMWTYRSLRKEADVSIFRRRIDPDIIANAGTLLMIYLLLLLAGTLVITKAENLGVMPVMFECASALGTVGLTLGLTPHLHLLSKLILIGFMYIGRCGGITVAYAMLRSTRETNSVHVPSERITVG